MKRALVLAIALGGCGNAPAARRAQDEARPVVAPARDPYEPIKIRGGGGARPRAPAELSPAPPRFSIDLASLRPDDPITLVPRAGPSIDAQLVSVEPSRIVVTLVKGGAATRGATFGLASLRDVVRGWGGTSADDPRAPLVPERWGVLDVRAIAGAPDGAELELLPFGRENASDAVGMNERGAEGFHRVFGLGAKPAVRLVVPGRVVINGKLARAFAPASEARAVDVAAGEVEVAFDSGARARVALAPLDVERDSGPDATPEGAAPLAKNAWSPGTVQLDGDRTDCWALVLDAPARVALYVHGRVEVVLLPATAPDTRTPWDLPAGRHVIRVRAPSLGPRVAYDLFPAVGSTPAELDAARLTLAFDDACSTVRRLDATRVKEILNATAPGPARVDFARAKLKDERSGARRMACQALALWKDRDSAELLNRIGVLDPDANVRLAARAASEELTRGQKRSR